MTDSYGTSEQPAAGYAAPGPGYAAPVGGYAGTGYVMPGYGTPGFDASSYGTPAYGTPGHGAAGHATGYGVLSQGLPPGSGAAAGPASAFPPGPYRPLLIATAAARSAPSWAVRRTRSWTR
jgi:hypothetical protein